MRHQRHRSTLFFFELVLTLTLFILCAAVSVSILYQSREASVTSAELNTAVFLAQNSAEALRVAPDALALARILDAEANGQTVSAFYDSHWQSTGDIQSAHYSLFIQLNEAGSLIKAEISVYRLLDQTSEIYNLNAAVCTEAT